MGGPLGDGLSGAIEGIEFNGEVAFYSAGPGPQSQCGIGIDCATVTHGSNSATSQQLVLVGAGDPNAANPAVSASSTFLTDTVLSQTVGGLPGKTGQRTANFLWGANSGSRGANNTITAVDFEPTQQGLSAGDSIGLPSGVWASLNGTRLSNNFVSTSFESDVTTFAGGVDWFWDDSLLVGLGFGFEQQDTKTFVNTGTAESTNVSIIPYAGYLINDNFSADLSVGYTNLDINQSRSIGTVVFDSEVDSRRYFVAGNFNAIHVAGPWLFTGTAGVLYAKENVDSFVETVRGAPTVTLSNASRSAKIGQWRVGTTGSYYHNGWEPYASVFFVKDFTSTSANLAAGVAVPSDDDDEVQLGAGVRYYDDALGMTASVEYNTVLGRDNIESNSVNLLLRFDL